MTCGAFSLQFWTFLMSICHGGIVSESINSLDNVKDEVKDMKEKCLSKPEKYIFGTATKKYP